MTTFLLILAAWFLIGALVTLYLGPILAENSKNWSVPPGSDPSLMPPSVTGRSCDVSSQQTCSGAHRRPSPFVPLGLDEGEQVAASLPRETSPNVISIDTNRSFPNRSLGTVNNNGAG